MPLHTIKRPDLAPYLNGTNLLGDDATPDELAAWFAEESRGYADISEQDVQFASQGARSTALNQRHFRNDLKGKKNLVGLVYGPADATELKSLDAHVKTWYVMEPGTIFHKQELYTNPAHFLPVSAKGELALADATIDVIVCLSVMHHIANASFVLAEMSRVLKPGGLLFLREPTVTMGNWLSARPGLTPNERGLPLGWLLNTCRSVGLTIVRASPAVFPPLDRFVRLFGIYKPYASAVYLAVDTFFSTLMAPFARYHRPRWYHRFAPAAVLLVARK